ncbi:MAG: hypothetical protein WEE89_16870 [Gemmatimonadota bacterium]
MTTFTIRTMALSFTAATLFSPPSTAQTWSISDQPTLSIGAIEGALDRRYGYHVRQKLHPRRQTTPHHSRS